MRNVRLSMAASGIVAFGALGWAMGCSASSQEDLTDPKLGKNLVSSSSGTTGAGGGASTSTTSTSGSSGSSGTGGTAPGCDPTESTFVSEMCGVFVAASGKTGATGTRTDPYPTLTEGIAEAVKTNKYVFACADTFNEQVTIKTGLALYGGREDCMKGWALKAGGATTISGPVDKIALTIDTPGSVTIENVDVVAPNAVAASASSIAVLVTNSAVAEFTNCNFTSHDAMKGDNGAPIAADPALDGTAGSIGKTVCSGGATHPGAPASVKTCGGDTSTGGKGGDGTAPAAMSGGNGTDGTVSDAAGTGTHGNGQTVAACTSGGQGGDGASGTDGLGASGLGVISASGYVGVSGGTGGTGTPGVGGGGGGGSKGTTVPIANACGNAGLTDYFGASGGSGGSGGCGGKAGNAGAAGGSSIALLMVDAAKVTLTGVTLTPGKGGPGGVGGQGQLGGAQGGIGLGGDANNGGGLKAGCAGGLGGSGGIGGPGGGGQGGHSLGLAYKGPAPTGMPTYPKIPPQAGAGGLAGPGAKNPAAGKGVDGNSMDPTSYSLEFK